MKKITIYGIKNCDTMKKTFQWFDAYQIPYEFHDYKKQGVDTNVLSSALEEHGWETILNRRGTTWRKLSDEIKNTMDNSLAEKVALDNPSIIKRPLVVSSKKIIVGFDQERYAIFLP